MARTPTKLPSITSDFLKAAREAYAQEKDVDTQLELSTKAGPYRDKVEAFRRALENTRKAWAGFTDGEQFLFLTACDPMEFHLRLFSSPLKTQTSEYGETTDYPAVAAEFTQRLEDALESLPFRLTKNRVKSIRARPENRLEKAFVRWLMMQIQEANGGILPTYYENSKEGDCPAVMFVRDMKAAMPKELKHLNPNTTVRAVLKKLRGNK